MTKRKKKQQNDTEEAWVAATDLLPIISDGAIMGPVADGRLLPVLDLLGAQLSGFCDKFQAAVPRRALAM
jgi:hypothetical protein